MRIFLIALVSVVELSLAALILFSLWLTPRRIENYITDKAEKVLNADVQLSGVSYSFWSTFPNITVRVKSVCVRSRNFDNLTPDQKCLLPAGSDTVLIAGESAITVNALKYPFGNTVVRNIVAGNLKLNLVEFSDSLTNYHIHWKEGASRIKNAPLDRLSIYGVSQVRYGSVVTGLSVDTRLDGFDINRVPGSDTGSYEYMTKGDVSVKYKGIGLIKKLNFSISGDAVIETHPLELVTDNMKLELDKVNLRLNLKITKEDELKFFCFGERLTLETIRAIASKIFSDSIGQIPSQR